MSGNVSLALLLSHFFLGRPVLVVISWIIGALLFQVGLGFFSWMAFALQTATVLIACIVLEYILEQPAERHGAGGSWKRTMKYAVVIVFLVAPVFYWTSDQSYELIALGLLIQWILIWGVLWGWTRVCLKQAALLEETTPKEISAIFWGEGEAVPGIKSASILSFDQPVLTSNHPVEALIIRDPRGMQGQGLADILSATTACPVPVIAVGESARPAQVNSLKDWQAYFCPRWLSPEDLFSHSLSQVSASQKPLQASGVVVGPVPEWLTPFENLWGQEESFFLRACVPWPASVSRQSCQEWLRQLIPLAPCHLFITWPKKMSLHEGLRHWHGMMSALRWARKKGLNLTAWPLVTPQSTYEAVLGAYGMLALKLVYGEEVSSLKSPIWCQPLWQQSWPGLCWESLKFHPHIAIPQKTKRTPAYLTAKDAWAGLKMLLTDDQDPAALGWVLQGPIATTYKESAEWMGRLAGYSKQDLSIILKQEDLQDINFSSHLLYPLTKDSGCLSSIKTPKNSLKLVTEVVAIMQRNLRKDEEGLEEALKLWAKNFGARSQKQ